MNDDLLMTLFRELARALQPLSDPEVKKALFESIGVSLPEQPLMPPEASAALARLAESPSIDWYALQSTLETIVGVIDSIRDAADTAALREQLDGSDLPWEQFLHWVPNAFATQYLRWRSPGAYALFQIIGFVDDQVGGLSNGTFAGRRWMQLFREGKLWADEAEDPDVRDKRGIALQLGATGLAKLALRILGDNFYVDVVPGFDAGAGALRSLTPRLDAELTRAVTIRFGLQGADADLGLDLRKGFSLTLSPPTDAAGGGLVVSVGGELEASVRLGENWAFGARATTTPAQVELSLGRESGRPPLTFTGFELGALRLTTSWAEERGFAVRLEVPDSAIVIRSGSDAVGERALGGQERVRIPFDLDLSVDEHGVHFAGGGARLTRAIGRRVGPVRIDSLGLALEKVDGGVGLSGVVDLGLDLGPLAATVTGLGFELVVDAAEGFGNLGPLNVKRSGFRRPDGVALTLDTCAMKGTGYLGHLGDQYAGALDVRLDIPGWKCPRLTVVALLATTLPSGQRGLSLFVQGALGFAPALPLGMGFELKKAALSLGYNRGFALETLRAGLQTGLVDSLLAPADPLANLAAAVAQLSVLFPVQDGAHTIVLSAALAWRSKLTCTLGLVFDTSRPRRVVVVGKLDIDLAPAGRLKLAAVGVLDLGAGEVSLRASLFDSKVAGAVVAGDAGLLLRWKGQKTFALSIGGFHKDFSSPLLLEPTFQGLRRFTLHVPELPALKVDISGYLALTTSSIQLGGQVDVKVGVAGILMISGGIGFDALFEWDPVYFVAEARGYVSLEVASFTLASLRFKGEISGPAPTRVRGSVTFEVLWWDVTKSVDESTAGTPPPEPPAIDAVSVLRAELVRPGAWEPDALRTDADRVRLTSGGNALLLHPLQSVTFRQQEVPLGVPITHIGRAKLTRPTTLGIQSMSLGGSTPELVPVHADFARARYQDLTPEQRLSSTGYEPMIAGARLDTDRAVRFGAKVVRADVSPIDVTPPPTTTPPTPTVKHPFGPREAAFADSMRFVAVTARGRTPR